jgi:predicted RNA-binding protein YlxR (DUF448 family)
MPNRRREPVRTCVACREEATKADLIRLVRSPGGEARIDRTGHAPGRGVYLHRRRECVELARKRRPIERSMGAGTSPELWDELGASV